ncbi:MAG: iron ABC transporter permease [Coriobacteriaceae bacterium]|nr:iron ABC transporter permease [Coriobacteriaceae bacterium]
MSSPRATPVLAVALAAVSAASLFIGVLDVDPAGLLSGDPEHLWVFGASRIPRLLAVLCSGAGMAIAGLIMQQLCMNKFVAPSTGATISSAQLGVLASLIWLPGAGLWGRALLSFAAATLGTWSFIWLIRRISLKDPVMVPLVGIMFGGIVSGITTYIAYTTNLTQALSTWLSGHFSLVVRGNYELVWLAVPLIGLAFAFAGHFNIVGMGRSFAENLGVNYDTVLFAGLAIASLITAAVVCVVGSVPYVGLVIPNLVTMFKGDRLEGTLADTALSGALFVLICDIVSRLVIFPYELPVDLTVGIIGSIAFITMLLRRLRPGRRGPASPERADRKAARP